MSEEEEMFENTDEVWSETSEEKTIISDLYCGRYRQLSLLGKGGMGEVSLCYDAVGGVEVALKRVPEKYATNKDVMTTIRKNFQVIQGLHHPNIGAVKTIEQDKETGEYFLIMEYIQGEDLEMVLQRHDKKMTLEQVLPYARQIAAALDYGHEHGIVHRDIKPQNIMITKAGVAKVLDYGIAAEFETTLQTQSRAKSIDITLASSGTPVYMAPEQWKGYKQDGRADQYALAATIYRLLSGKPPFAGGDQTMLQNAVLTQPVEPLEELDKKFWPALEKALAKEPGDRFETCTAFVEALAGGGKGGGSSAGAKSIGKFLWPLVGGLVLVLGGMALMSKKDKPPTGNQVQVPPAPVAERALKYHAVVIGVDQYANGWQPLKNAANDAGDIANLLESDYGFQVTRLVNEQATQSNIMGELERISVGMDVDDNVLIYFAGHGENDEKLREGYWIPVDARPASEGAAAKASWVWNSIITRFLEASSARHILVVADSCYAGSLFRGRQAENRVSTIEEYASALNRPSRYVIASGSYKDKVYDGDGRNSPFAEALLAALSQDRPMIGASELAATVDLAYAAKTEISLRQGPLFRATDGEFIFFRKNARIPETLEVAADDATEKIVSASAGDAVRLLHEEGYTNAASRLLAKLVAANPQDQLTLELAEFVDGAKRVEKQQQLQEMISYLAEQSKKEQDPKLTEALKNFGKPRILSVIGPADQVGSTPSRMLATNLRNALSGELANLGGFRLVDRRNLDDALSEMRLSDPDVSDDRVSSLVGKLLPASLMITGDIVADHEGLYVTLRLIESQSTALLGQFEATITEDKSWVDEAKRLAAEIRATAIKERPITARIQKSEAAEAWIGLAGKFHGVTKDMPFDVIDRVKLESVVFEEYREKVLGPATIQVLGENTIDLDLGGLTPGESAWLKERAAE